MSPSPPAELRCPSCWRFLLELRSGAARAAGCGWEITIRRPAERPMVVTRAGR